MAEKDRIKSYDSIAECYKDKSPNEQRLHMLIRRKFVPETIKFLTLKDNISGLYCIPSHENWFGPIKVSNLISDPGCKDHLIAISSNEMLEQIFNLFPESEYYFSLSTYVGTAGPAQVLLITNIDKQFTFPVKFGVDLFGEQCTATLNNLRFLLSSGNAQTIISDPLKSDRFVTTDVEILYDYANMSVPMLPVSLIGNMLADQFDEIKIGDVRFYLNYQQFMKESGSFQDLPKLAREVSAALTLDTESKAAMLGFAEYTFHKLGLNAEYDF